MAKKAAEQRRPNPIKSPAIQRVASELVGMLERQNPTAPGARSSYELTVGPDVFDIDLTRRQRSMTKAVEPEPKDANTLDEQIADGAIHTIT